MANAQIQLKGREALQKKLNEKRKQILNFLDTRLLQLAEEAVAYSMAVKGYKDHTANLKNSISFALFRDGSLISRSVGNKYQDTYVEDNKEHKNPLTKGEVMQMRTDALEAYAKQDGVVAPKGYSLVIVAGMNYGKYVEDKGYNVLYLTRYYLRDEMKKVLQEAFELIKDGG